MYTISVFGLTNIKKSAWEKNRRTHCTLVKKQHSAIVALLLEKLLNETSLVANRELMSIVWKNRKHILLQSISSAPLFMQGVCTDTCTHPHHILINMAERTKKSKVWLMKIIPLAASTTTLLLVRLTQRLENNQGQKLPQQQWDGPPSDVHVTVTARLIADDWESKQDIQAYAHSALLPINSTTDITFEEVHFLKRSTLPQKYTSSKVNIWWAWHFLHWQWINGLTKKLVCRTSEGNYSDCDLLSFASKEPSKSNSSSGWCMLLNWQNTWFITHKEYSTLLHVNYHQLEPRDLFHIVLLINI